MRNETREAIKLIRDLEDMFVYDACSRSNTRLRQIIEDEKKSEDGRLRFNCICTRGKINVDDLVFKSGGITASEAARNLRNNMAKLGVPVSYEKDMDKALSADDETFERLSTLLENISSGKYSEETEPTEGFEIVIRGIPSPERIAVLCVGHKDFADFVSHYKNTNHRELVRISSLEEMAGLEFKAVLATNMIQQSGIYIELLQAARLRVR